MRQTLLLTLLPAWHCTSLSSLNLLPIHAFIVSPDTLPRCDQDFGAACDSGERCFTVAFPVRLRNHRSCHSFTS
jgi:hypothetical protein